MTLGHEEVKENTDSPPSQNSGKNNKCHSKRLPVQTGNNWNHDDQQWDKRHYHP